MQKLIFIDTETTGIDVSKHEVVQLAAIITNDDASEVIDEINITIKPEYVQNIDPEAIAVCHKTVDDLLANDYTVREAHQKFCDWMSNHVDRYDKKDKLQFIAYNSKFDENFVRKLFDQAGDNYYGSWFWNPSICVMQEMAFVVRNHRYKLPRFRLCDICEFLDIEFNEEQDAHDALYDVRKTIDVFRQLI